MNYLFFEGSVSFEALLVDLQRPDLRLQSGSCYAELGSRTGRSMNLSFAFAQRSPNDCLFQGRKPLFGSIARSRSAIREYYLAKCALRRAVLAGTECIRPIPSIAFTVRALLHY